MQILKNAVTDSHNHGVVPTMTTPNQADDIAAIHQLFQRLNEAWNAGDASAYGALFTEDADYFAFDGANQKGRTAIIAGHKPLFENYLKGSRLTGELISLRFLAADVALVHTVGSIIDRGRTTPKAERRSSQTLIATKSDGKWYFTAFHNTRVRPIGGGIRSLMAWAVADLAWKLLGPKTSDQEQAA